MNKLSVIVPCFNEEAVLEKSSAIIRNKMKSLADAGKISSDSFILLIDDGSTDRTWDIISQLCHDDKTFCGLKLSCNNGHQNALLAGLRFVADKCEACISIDADLQDDINAMDPMIDKFHGGYEI
ncbi:MAG: glycosyltransferase, partial [Bacteroidales bacterium]|nr:glycosyltransferase [Bacteroidales bacterium]